MTTPCFVARLLDLEGVTVAEMAVPPRSNGHPPLHLEAAVLLPIKARFVKQESPEAPIGPIHKRIVYELERVAGDGVLIYRRTTGPWG